MRSSLLSVDTLCDFKRNLLSALCSSAGILRALFDGPLLARIRRGFKRALPYDRALP